MIRLSALFWLILVAATGFAMFAVKYEVQALADQLARTTRQADDAERDVRVLDADWAYLNRPDALAAMNQRFLSLAPIATKQLITSVAGIPMRPPPPPPVEAAAVVAETTPQQGGSPASNGPISMPSQASAALQQPSAPKLAAQSATPVAAVAVRVPAPEPARSVLIQAAARRHPAPRVRTLDALIAQIAESR
jgi:cell division protein FtsL